VAEGCKKLHNEKFHQMLLGWSKQERLEGRDI